MERSPGSSRQSLLANSQKETHGIPQNGFSLVRRHRRIAGRLRIIFLVQFGCPVSLR